MFGYRLLNYISQIIASLKIIIIFVQKNVSKLSELFYANTEKQSISFYKLYDKTFRYVNHVNLKSIIETFFLQQKCSFLHYLKVCQRTFHKVDRKDRNPKCSTVISKQHKVWRKKYLEGILLNTRLCGNQHAYFLEKKN